MRFLQTFFLLLFVFLSACSVTIDEVREKEPITLYATYIAYACGEHYPRIYWITSPQEKLERFNDQAMAQRALLLALPSGLLDPESSDFSVSGNFFKLTGYRSKQFMVNSYTKQRKELPGWRFDLMAWEVIAPYQVWKKEKGEEVTQVTKTKVMQFKINNPTTFQLKHYDGCP